MSSTINAVPSDHPDARRDLAVQEWQHHVHPLVRPLTILAGLVGLTLRRIASRPTLSLLALMGIILAVGLVSSAAFFAQAVDLILLRQELNELSRVTGRPPFATRVYTLPSARQPLTVAEAEELTPQIANTFAAEVGLPVRNLEMHAESGSMMLRPKEGDTRYGDDRTFLGTADIGFVTNIAEHMHIIAGTPFGEVRSDDMLHVWVHRRLAETLGLSPGEELAFALNLAQPPVNFRVAGIWEPADRDDPYWFNDPNSAFEATLLVRPEDYVRFVEPVVPARTGFVGWQVTLDDQQIRPQDARQYADGFERGMITISQRLPTARLDVSPLDSLANFTERQTTLTTVLLAFNLPAFGFLLAFLVLTSAIIARWQSAETVTLVSRGTGPGGILASTFVEQGLLSLIGYPIGIGAGMLIAILMGATSSFLEFAPRPPMPVSLDGLNMPLTLLALAVALVARLAPTALTTRQSVVTYEREHNRPRRAPLWYRAKLDLLLIIPTVYAYQQLRNRGSFATLVEEEASDLYRDPLLILVPALFILTAGLLALRVFPLLMRVIDRLAGALPGSTIYLALRQLARQSHSYINPMLLLIVALALGIYTASLAASLDQWLEDRIYYSVGADIGFEPFLESAQEQELVGAEWIPPPHEFLELPGVVAAARVGDYPASVFLSSGRSSARVRFIGVDRLEFPSAAWFRPDFADQSLGGLMNELALTPEAVLVSEEFFEENGLRIGDQINIQVALDTGLDVTSSFMVVGTYRYFPTVYEDQTAVIGNLDYLFSFYGFTFPHRIWLRTTPDADTEAIFDGIARKGFDAIVRHDSRALIAEERSATERVGVFGTLTVGFLAAALLAMIGLLIHSYAALQERLFNFAVFRAMGLSRRQIAWQVLIEYGVLGVYGALAGALIGAGASRLFTPFFRTATEGGDIPLPPLIPVVAELPIATLALTFAVAVMLVELVVISTAMRRRLFDMLAIGGR